MANPNFVPVMSSNEIFRNEDTGRCLTDDLDAIESNIAELENHSHTASEVGAAEASHTHSGFAAANHTHTGFASEDHNHDTKYAAQSHSHTGFASADHTHTGFAASGHTHTAVDVGAAAASHSHSGYATSGHNHDSAYAAKSHTHSGYAAADHDHDEYFSANGGTVNGDTNVAGVIRANGQQAFYYAPSTNSQTIGTANATGGTTIACGASANTVINGANVKTKNMLPQASNTHTLGSTSLRWKGIYSNAAVNVTSDIRLKKNIEYLDPAIMAEFVDKLNVAKYDYLDDAEGAPVRIGLIAQDVVAADHELSKYFVTEDEQGMLGLRPADLVFPLIMAVQRLSTRVAELEAQK